MKTFPALLLAGLLAPTFQRSLAADVDLVGIAEVTAYFQATTGSPALADIPYQFSAFVQTSNDGVVTGNLKLPDGTLLGMPRDFGDPPSLDRQFPTLSELTAAFPNGGYTVQLTTVHDGNRDFVIQLPAGGFPAAPVLSNPSALGTVDPNSPYTLQWTLVGGTASDVVVVQVHDIATDNAAFKTPEPGKPGVLNGTANSVVITAGSLQAGSVYAVRVLHAKLAAAGTGYATSLSARGSATEALLATTGKPLDARQVGLVAGAFFDQGTTGAPVPNSHPFQAQLFVDSGNSGVVDGSLKFPDGTSQALPSRLPDAPNLQSNFQTATAMAGMFPAGTYTVSLNTVHNGKQTFALSLPAQSLPAAPVFLDPASMRSIDPTQPLVVKWSPFPGASPADYVQLSIEYPDGTGVYQSQQPGVPAALNGASTSFTIPAGILDHGTEYRALLLIGKVQLGSTDGTLLIAGDFSETTLVLKTTGTTTQPVLTITKTGDSQYTLHATGANGRNYVIEGTSALSNPSWEPLVNYNGSAGGFDFTDGVVRGDYFYRVRSTN